MTGLASVKSFASGCFRGLWACVLDRSGTEFRGIAEAHDQQRYEESATESDHSGPSSRSKNNQSSARGNQLVSGHQFVLVLVCSCRELMGAKGATPGTRPLPSHECVHLFWLASKHFPFEGTLVSIGGSVVTSIWLRI